MTPEIEKLEYHNDCESFQPISMQNILNRFFLFIYLKK